MLEKNDKRREKIKRLLRNLEKRKSLSLLSVALLVGISVFLFNFNKVNAPFPVDKLTLLSSFAENKTADFSDLGKVDKYEVENPKATVVYFPQIHKEPTSQASDPKNDKAAVAQKEIYNSLEKLVDQHGVKYVMDESDLYGPMPSEKIQKVENGFRDINNFKNATDTVIKHYLQDGGSKEVADKLKKDSDVAISNYERNLYLAGGAAVLAAKEDKSQVYGSQVKSTLDESKRQLENIVYLEKRISQLEGKNKISGLNRSLSTDQLNTILSKSKGSSSSSKMFNGILNFATKAQNSALIEQINDAKSKLGNLSTTKSFEAMTKFSDAPHNDNPYKNTTNLASLKKEYNSAYKDFMKIVKDQRSQEAADNVEKMMNENHEEKAALVFGAQHQDQIVEALNKKGISVIVVTTPAVSGYQATH